MFEQDYPAWLKASARRSEYTTLRSMVSCQAYLPRKRLKHVPNLDVVTEKIPLKRLGDPDEFGAFMAFLASEQAAHNGAVFLDRWRAFSGALIVETGGYRSGSFVAQSCHRPILWRSKNSYVSIGLAS